MDSLPSLSELEAAAAIIRPHVPPTPQFRWPLLDQPTGREIWVKHENHTPLGAFKVRGGLVYVEALRRRTPAVRTVVSATRGNHGQSVAFAAARHGLHATIVVPRGNSRAKNTAMRALGAELVEAGNDFQAALEHAHALAEERGAHFVPSFARELVAGVGTYALEFLRGTEPLDEVYVPIGLGSGFCGLLAAREALGSRTRLVGVISAHAPAYALSLAAGQPVSHPATTELADGIACRTPQPAALPWIARGADRIVQVTDAEVAAAMRLLFDATHQVAEGAGAAALAAILQEGPARPGRQRVGVVLSGGNVDREVFTRVLQDGTRDRAPAVPAR